MILQESDMAKLNYNKKELEDLLRHFHTLTGMIFTLYDNEGTQLISYPEKYCAFCRQMYSSAESKKCCIASDRSSFEASKASGECVIYTCHAGLVEATAPIINDGFIIGYLMLGQISNAASKEQLENILKHAFARNQISVPFSKAFTDDIPLLTDTQILASAKIMEACISYILYKNLISIERHNFETNINQYILSHLDGDLSVDAICNQLKISRRKLYDYSNHFLRCSIARHIKNLRIEHAKKLLTKTTLPISAISEKCGFSDYNYFCRVFKKETGMPARTYRKKGQVL